MNAFNPVRETWINDNSPGVQIANARAAVNRLRDPDALYEVAMLALSNAVMDGLRDPLDARVAAFIADVEGA